MNLLPNAKINAIVNTNAGRMFAIYNEIVDEIDDCSMIAVRHNSLHAIFPEILPAIMSAVRYIDGNLYFIVKGQFFKYNEFTRSVTIAGKFDAEIFDIVCPRDGLLEQLRAFLKRLAQMRNVFSSEDDLEEEREEEEERNFSYSVKSEGYETVTNDQYRAISPVVKMYEIEHSQGSETHRVDESDNARKRKRTLDDDRPIASSYNNAGGNNE
ncbi:hypothetical protein P5V15_001136 [Pogonomyrmex californicus]